MSIVLTVNGSTHRHSLAAEIGDLWIGNYTKSIVCITSNEDHYISYEKMRPDGTNFTRHKADFYVMYSRIVENDL